MAYEYTTRPVDEVIAKARVPKQKELFFSPQLVGGIGVVIGALIAVPPMSADAKWKSAMKAGNLQQAEAALVNTYLAPSDSARISQAVITFEQSKLPEQALKYAKYGVQFNPNNFDAWRVLYATTTSTPEDKELALANMKRLDPKNPDVLAQ